MFNHTDAQIFFRWMPFLLVLQCASWYLADSGWGAERREPVAVRSAIPSFPGAEGFGATTPGGRKGAVFAVTNLGDEGPGSLRAALEAEGPRIVVFRVSGVVTIDRPINIDHPYLTVAGQTTPGDGICVRGETTNINTHDVIIRYLRFRRGPHPRRDDALGGNPVGNIIIDHCSCSWGLDENISLYRHMKYTADDFGVKLPTENLTIQWTISSEALNTYNHAFGGTWGGRNVSLHHNLFACNTGRNPSIGWGDLVDYRNNVVFNWRHRTLDGGAGDSLVNVANNYYKPGPVTEPRKQHLICRPQHLEMHSGSPLNGKWYVSGNFVAGFPAVTRDNWNGGVVFDDVPREAYERMTEQVRAPQPFAVAPVRTQTAEAAFELVLASAGATLPRRDSVDERVIDAVRSGMPAQGDGIINDPDEVGGWPDYRTAEPPQDTDHDGMPDVWEQQHGLDPQDARDGRQDLDEDGYSNVEEWLNRTDPTAFVDYWDPANNISSL